MGAILFPDDHIRYYEYNGTCDVPISHHYETPQEVRDNWRKHDWLTCECGGEEDVEVYSDYGGGFYFDGKACMRCGSLHAVTDEGYVHITDVTPEMLPVNHWAKPLFLRNY